MLLLLPITLAQVPPPVINGDFTTDYEEVPMLYIIDSTGRSGAMCTGSLIHEDWVLTAAHCVSDSPGFVIGQVQVYFGSGMRDIFEDVQVDDWYVHRGYNGQGYDDIALLHLAKSITDIPLMQLASEEVGRSDIGKDFRIVGWGMTSDNDNGSNPAKKMADVPLSEFDDRLMMTFDTEDDQNACHGDSGGPVLRLYDDGTYAIAGVVNFAYGNWGADCENNGLASARVDYYLEWIQEYTEVEIHSSGGDGGFDPDLWQTGESPAGDVLSSPPRPASEDENYQTACGGCNSSPDPSWATLMGISVLLGYRKQR